jgi:cellulose synthase (UDP-forming)
MSDSFKRLILYLLIAAGGALSGDLLVYCWKLLIASWYTVAGPLLIVYLVGYLVLQLYFVWYLYGHFWKTEVPQALPGFSVDVFITAYNEPFWMVEKTLGAAKEITYPHHTFLLDDSPGRAYKALAERLNTGYLTRDNNHDRKAGNINEALKRTSGEFVTVFDIDHTPQPNFLDRTLGFFKDPIIGFVQGMVTFCNENDGLIPQASAQTGLEYFNITAVCKDRVGAMSLHGTNAVIRRKALESIGGYRPGLAEDLETSIALHGQGWKSAYVCEPLAPGLAPATFQAFCKQQLKWSSGVFEAAWRALSGGAFSHLTWHQRLAYSVRFSYYLVGLSQFVGILLTLYELFKPDCSAFEGFLARLLPFTAIGILIRWFMLRSWGSEPAARKGVHFKGASLVFSIWPIYLLSLVCTVIRRRIPFMSTPKDSSGDVALWTIAPQILMIGALVIGVVWKMLHWYEGEAPLTLLVALLLIGQQWMLSFPVWRIWKKAFSPIKKEAIQAEI